MTWFGGEQEGLTCIAHSDLGGYGDGMQIARLGDALYVGHVGTTGMGTTILDVGSLERPEVVRQLPAPPGTHTHKVQVADGLLLTNQEALKGQTEFASAMMVYDLADPFDPQPIGSFDPGGRGVHRIVWTGGRYAYISATPDGFDDRMFVIVDMSDPTAPVEAGRWWWPGAWRGGGESPDWPDDRRYAAHHALIDGDLAYLGYTDAGLVVLDISDRTQPRHLSTCSWRPGGRTHTCLPLLGRGLVVVTDEATRDRCQEETKLIRVVDVHDPRAPEVVGICPAPVGDFCERGLRFGPHNLHENQPGSYASDTLVFATYFNAGLRVFDVSDPLAPTEVAHWLPDKPLGQEQLQSNDLLVDADHNIFVSDRVGGGICVLRPTPELDQLMKDHAR